MTGDEAYRLAEQKIKEALQSGAKGLRLGAIVFEKSPRTTALLESLGQLTQLQSLNFANNRLTSLPESIGQLAQLQSLVLHNNRLTALPESIGQLAQLESLNVNCNKLLALPRSLGQLTQLQSLHLGRNNLTGLPEPLGQLTQLRSLDLSYNQLTALPGSIGRLTELRSLDLNGNELTALPESLGQLSQLQSLDLSRNNWAALPEALRQLTQLQTLDLSGNQLTELPEWLSELTQLQSLQLYANQLTTLPEWIGQLAQLRSLNLGGNKLAGLPRPLCALVQLRELDVSGNQLPFLSDWIGNLSSLERLVVNANKFGDLPIALGSLKCLKVLHLGGSAGGAFSHLPAAVAELRGLKELCLLNCSLKNLPPFVLQLENLEKLDLDKNPLNPWLAAAYSEGLSAVKRYLREMAKGARERYEAKLLILGDGNEGKTCVSRALRGLPFCKQKTTRGVDVKRWTFAHPDDAADGAKEITLNIWDFEGQEISHQTHQFFLTSQSMYLLVFKCRDLFLTDRAEYWLDTIRGRAPKAKVAIVITQCEERSPHLPLDRLQAQYGDLLAAEWFFTVGCKIGLSVEKLKTFLQRWAADLDFMGSPWPTSYDKAEKAIKAKTRTAHVSRDTLHATFAKGGVSEGSYEDAAAAMSLLGVITQFPDCPDLREFVVLRPQWLTKAISNVMEDSKLSEDKGEITLTRMEGIWNRAHYRGMFATFHTCMKEFELCYDIEDGSRSCLVPLRFGYVRPPIPWTARDGTKERRVEYKLNIRPPMGIMSRFIVKTHHMIVTTPEHPKGIYWHNGVFLRTGNGPLCSEALCEFVPEDRKLRIEVRAAFPQNLCEQIHAFIKAVFSFFGGLEAERSYGCIKVDPKTQAEERCSGLHTEKRIYSEISKQRIMDCEFEDHEVDPNKLIWGLSSFSEFVKARVISVCQLREELDKQPAWAEPYMRGAETLLRWVDDNGAKIDQLLQGQSALSVEFKQETELKLHEYLKYMSEMLDDRDHTAAPGLFSITTKDRSKWNPVGYFSKTYNLTPFCECPGNIHACEDGEVQFTKDEAWWEKSAPWMARGTKLLAAGLLLGFAGMPLVLGAAAADAIKDQVKFMQELTKHMELKAPQKGSAAANKVVGEEGVVGRDMRGKSSEAALMRAALERLLEETAPDNYHARRWGSLRRVRMGDNSYRWLCEQCAKSCR